MPDPLILTLSAADYWEFRARSLELAETLRMAQAQVNEAIGRRDALVARIAPDHHGTPETRYLCDDARLTLTIASATGTA